MSHSLLYYESRNIVRNDVTDRLIASVGVNCGCYRVIVAILMSNLSDYSLLYL